MKINGKRFDKPHISTLVLPRGDEELVFQAQAVLSYEEFDRLCPMPQPPKQVKPGGEVVVDVNDKDYQAAINSWGMNKTHFMILESLKVSPNLEWEKVDYKNPSTWHLYAEELREAFFTENEIGLLVRLAADVNSVDEDKLEAARKRFLARQVAM